jgi:hypothetical protein
VVELCHRRQITESGDTEAIIRLESSRNNFLILGDARKEWNQRSGQGDLCSMNLM